MSETYQDRLHPDGALRLVLYSTASACAVFGLLFGVMAILDDSLTGIQRLLAIAILVILTGTMIPLWLFRMAVVVKVDDRALHVRLWPFREVTVPRQEIDEVETVVVDPLKEFGGWGIKGSRDNQLFGMSGIHGVRVQYRLEGSQRRLTILTPNSSALVDALDA